MAFNSASGGTIRPGGPEKGKKTGEYWAAVQADLNAQSKEIEKKSKNSQAGSVGSKKARKAKPIKKSDFI